jgi:hypothetical protein
MNDDDTRFNRRFLAYFAIGLCVAAMAYVACITFLVVPTANVRFADTVLGFILGTVLATPIAFFYGSSKSSQAKDAVITAMVPPPDFPPPTDPERIAP